MSFILDALRKSELERQRQSGPSIAELPVAREDRRLPAALVAIGALLAVNIAVLAYFLLREEPATSAADTATVAAAPAAAAPAALPQPVGAAPPPRTLESEFAPAEIPARAMTEPPASRAPEAPDPTLLPGPPYAANAVASPAAPPLATLPPQTTAGLAELNVDLHIYSAEPAKRAVFVNGRRYTEGMALAEGPQVEEITRDGVVVNHRGQRFLLPRN